VSLAAACFNDFWFDAFSIIANEHPEQAILVPDLSFNLASPCVPESIAQQFAGDAVSLVLDERIQSLPLPFYCHTEDYWVSVSILGLRQILTRCRQQLRQIALNCRLGT
jgi:hypothetical protein